MQRGVAVPEPQGSARHRALDWVRSRASGLRFAHPGSTRSQSRSLLMLPAPPANPVDAANVDGGDRSRNRLFPLLAWWSSSSSPSSPRDASADGTMSNSRRATVRNGGSASDDDYGDDGTLDTDDIPLSTSPRPDADDSSASDSLAIRSPGLDADTSGIRPNSTDQDADQTSTVRNSAVGGVSVGLVSVRFRHHNRRRQNIISSRRADEPVSEAEISRRNSAQPPQASIRNNAQTHRSSRFTGNHDWIDALPCIVIDKHAAGLQQALDRHVNTLRAQEIVSSTECDSRDNPRNQLEDRGSDEQADISRHLHSRGAESGELDYVMREHTSSGDGEDNGQRLEDLHDTPKDAKHSVKHQSFETNDCAICISDFEAGDEVVILPCVHLFHSQCVKTWLVQVGTCPLCRIPVMKAVRDSVRTPQPESEHAPDSEPVVASQVRRWWRSRANRGVVAFIPA